MLRFTLAGLLALICLSIGYELFHTLILLKRKDFRPKKLEISILSRFGVGYLLSIGLFLIFLLSLGYGYYTSNFSIFIIWKSAPTSLSPVNRCLRMFLTSSGAILEWLVIFYGMSFVVLWKAQKNIVKLVNDSVEEDGGLEHQAIYVFLKLKLGILIELGLLFILYLFLHPLQPTDPLLLLLYPQGARISSEFTSILGIIHPFMIFCGYSAASLPFIIELAESGSSVHENIRKGFDRIALRFGQITTFIFGFGIAVGMLWARFTSTWGTFWHWDPIETASLFTWLLAVTYLIEWKSNALTSIFTAIWELDGRKIGRILLSLGLVNSICYLFLLARDGSIISLHAWNSQFQSTIFQFAILLFQISIMVIFFWKHPFPRHPENQSSELLNTRYAGFWFEMELLCFIFGLYLLNQTIFDSVLRNRVFNFGLLGLFITISITFLRNQVLSKQIKNKEKIVPSV